MKRIWLALLLVLASVQAYAGSILCAGTVEDLSYHATNRLMIRLSSMNVPVYFCNPDAEWVVAGTGYKTGPETCKTLYSTFLAAHLSGKSLTNVHFDGDGVPAACDTWAPWTSANIRHFIL